MKKQMYNTYMLKRYICLTAAFWFLSLFVALAQNRQIDSLKTELSKPMSDSARVDLLVELDRNYLYYSPDSSLEIARQAYRLARQNKYVLGEGRALEQIYVVYLLKGELPEALEKAFATLKIAQSIQNSYGIANSFNNIGFIYSKLGGYRQAIGYYRQGLVLAEQNAEKRKGLSNSRDYKKPLVWVLSGIANVYIKMEKLDSARIVNEQAYDLAKKNSLPLTTTTLINTGLLELGAGRSHKALLSFKKALTLADPQFDRFSRSDIYLELAKVFDKIQQPDSSFYYATLALKNSQPGFKAEMLRASTLLAKLYKSKPNLDSTVYYLELAKAINDSLYGPEKFQRIQLLALNEQQQQQDLLSQKQAYQDRIRFYGLLSGLVILLLIAFGLWFSNRQKQRANALLQRQKQEIDHQRSKAESALSELTITQAQLIQKEKLASLGELTAGIAHEIQNPLNFVNNFSEVSTDLVEELKEEALAGHTDDVLAIADDLAQNLQKITHHGGRASSIVKGMLEHSRTGTGERQFTDLNALADEYLRLAYHGQRSKDKEYNCEIVTDFDSSIGKINIVPQEIGRVLLNLYNNAFYAVKERSALGKGQELYYRPTVWVSTKRLDKHVEIRVTDNGTGIPESVKAKIFQPFFTTKPTGEGTGLGLSLSYDIITKGHGGTFNVVSTEGEGTTFIILLPVTIN